MKKLRRSSLSGDAYVFVRDLFINSKRYNPGDKISVEELSRELGVSRTPLWGAINRLEAEGIVEIVPRQGVYLIDYDPHRALEIYTAREALEGMAARLAAAKITDRQLSILRAKVDEQRALLEKGDVRGLLQRGARIPRAGRAHRRESDARAAADVRSSHRYGRCDCNENMCRCICRTPARIMASSWRRSGCAIRTSPSSMRAVTSGIWRRTSARPRRRQFGR